MLSASTIGTVAAHTGGGVAVLGGSGSGDTQLRFSVCVGQDSQRAEVLRCAAPRLRCSSPRHVATLQALLSPLGASVCADTTLPPHTIQFDSAEWGKWRLPVAARLHPKLSPSAATVVATRRFLVPRARPQATQRLPACLTRVLPQPPQNWRRSVLAAPLLLAWDGQRPADARAVLVRLLLTSVSHIPHSILVVTPDVVAWQRAVVDPPLTACTTLETCRIVITTPARLRPATDPVDIVVVDKVLEQQQDLVAQLRSRLPSARALILVTCRALQHSDAALHTRLGPWMGARGHPWPWPQVSLALPPATPLAKGALKFMQVPLTLAQWWRVLCCAEACLALPPLRGLGIVLPPRRMSRGQRDAAIFQICNTEDPVHKRHAKLRWVVHHVRANPRPTLVVATASSVLRRATEAGLAGCGGHVVVHALADTPPRPCRRGYCLIFLQPPRSAAQLHRWIVLTRAETTYVLVASPPPPTTAATTNTPTATDMWLQQDMRRILQARGTSTHTAQWHPPLPPTWPREGLVLQGVADSDMPAVPEHVLAKHLSTHMPRVAERIGQWHMQTRDGGGGAAATTPSATATAKPSATRARLEAAAGVPPLAPLKSVLRSTWLPLQPAATTLSVWSRYVTTMARALCVAELKSHGGRPPMAGWMQWARSAETVAGLRQACETKRAALGGARSHSSDSSDDDSSSGDSSGRGGAASSVASSNCPSSPRGALSSSQSSVEEDAPGCMSRAS
jgi:hypothetical protein